MLSGDEFRGRGVRCVTSARTRRFLVLFFNGSLVHGSYPNTTTDRFRRALIGHYIEGAAAQVAHFYHPALRMDGTPLELATSEEGGACGVWVERDGVPVVEMIGREAIARKHE